MAIDPSGFAGVDFAARVDTLLTTMLAQPGVRLPGDRRLSARATTAREGVRVSARLLDEIETLRAGGEA